MQPGQFAVRSSADALERERPAPQPRAALGHVVSVNGSRAVIAVDAADQSHTSEEPLSVGKLLAIEAGTSAAIGLVYSAEAARPGGIGKPGAVLVSVELVGEIRTLRGARRPSFDRGIRSYPSVGAGARPIGAAELETIYDYTGSRTIAIGRLAQDDRIEATLRVNDLMQKHFAVLGTTGCGKSCAVALLLREVLASQDDARVLLIDPHNEYRSAFRDKAHMISPRNLSLPFWLFNFEELVDVIYRRRPGVEEEIDALADLIQLAKARYGRRNEPNTLLRREVDESAVSVDAPIPYRMHDIIGMIDQQIGKLDARDDRPKLRRLKMRIQSVMNDSRYQFMFASWPVEDLMADLLRTLFRVPSGGKPITIVEMAGFPSEVVDAVVSVLCRIAFDFGVWGNGRVPLIVVCEEAHRYVPADKRLGFGPTRRAISRIAKEGRKYGVYLGLVTQRPSELDPTILSQCSTIFAMRMANESDHGIIRAAVSDAAASTLAALPSIGNREAIAFGEAVSMPMRVRFSPLPPDAVPAHRLATMRGEPAGNATGDFIDEVVERWRASTERDI